MEYLTHFYLGSVPDQFKTNLFWLQVFSWILFAQLGIEDAIRSKIQKLERLKLSFIQENIYKILVLEFITTLIIQDMRGVADLQDNIQFKLGGEHRQMSIWEFTRAMDIYLANFVDSPEAFATVAREFDFPCFKAFYESEVKKFNNRPWDVKISKASEVKPEWRLIHHVIARSVGGNNRSKGNLTGRDFILFQSMHLPQSLHLVLAILSIFKRYETNRRLTTLHGGAYVTRLAKYFDVDFLVVQFRLDSRTTPISFDILKSRIIVLHLSDNGIWGVRGLPFPTTNTLDMDGMVFRLLEATTVRG
ncbi:unnamed protein product [Linum trigynum]|uniref:Uncharacterized protein n=1 Tax=Linum trigynum TaxID=586398 RepID=A0AAV2D1L2_9ROSI